ncbi:hypothetical protein CENSYa_0553 [Cenarchaeum symbiosum A]|uniref:Uncharacterized protein n=1 Tax=Cenarchaeum symbiosum (strain A) TaxID=414004 RepID=A0RV19_CENSY|nr:hypothetical protein CENSYa_0553 [Cenarchaeum symbiosum A]
MTEERRYIDFEVVKERWNVYELEDGTKLKTRNTLRSVWVETDSLGAVAYHCDIHNMRVVLCHTSKQGEKDQTPHTPSQLMENIEKRVCRYETMSYEASEYTLDNNVGIVFHLNLNRISRTSLFDPKGDRIYLSDLRSSRVLYLPNT